MNTRWNKSQFYRKENGRIVQFCAKVLSVDYSHGLIEAFRWDNSKHIEASWSGCKDIQEGKTYWFRPAGHDRGGNIDAKYVLIRPRRRYRHFDNQNDGVTESERAELKAINDTLMSEYDLPKILKHLKHAIKIGRGEASIRGHLVVGNTDSKFFRYDYSVEFKVGVDGSWLCTLVERRGKKFSGSFHTKGSYAGRYYWHGVY